MHAFDLATAVRGGPGSWQATVDPGWTIGDRPNGGYLLALAARAALGEVDHPHPLAVSGQFLAPPAAGRPSWRWRRCAPGARCRRPG